jgi:hypothetical protein
VTIVDGEASGPTILAIEVRGEIEVRGHRGAGYCTSMSGASQAHLWTVEELAGIVDSNEPANGPTTRDQQHETKTKRETKPAENSKSIQAIEIYRPIERNPR